MKRLLFFGLCAVFIVTTVTRAGAQVFKTVDPTKQADVNGKVINSNNLNLKSVTEPALNFSPSSRSNERQSLPQVQLKNADLQQLQLSSYPTQILPRQNFTTRRAAIAERPADTNGIAITRPPITDRVLRPFAPGGEEELKKQLNEPH